MVLAGGGIPADVLIPRFTLPGRCSKQDTGQRTPQPVAHQILEIFPNRSAMAQIMVTLEQVRKQSAQARLRWVADFLHAQGQQLRKPNVEGVRLGKPAGLGHGF